MKKTVVIIGAGPAGLTAGYELLHRFASEYDVFIIEKTNQIGGLAQTVQSNTFRMDIGGHRYFSKNERIINWWRKALPKGDLLEVKRSSLIFYQGGFLDYPVRINRKTVTTVGLMQGFEIILSYLKSKIRKVDESTLEGFYTNRFGKKLYTMFFKDYTEKVWGRCPADIPSDWGYQRVKGLSFFKVLADIVCKNSTAHQEITLTDHFYYPRYGSGYLWEQIADKIVSLGGHIIKDNEITSIETDGRLVNRVKCCSGLELNPDFLISSMPLKELIGSIQDVPEHLSRIASSLEYRDFVIVGLLLKKKHFADTPLQKEDGTIIPDQWLYIQDITVRMGRIQIFDNWSPGLRLFDDDLICIGLEYFCQEGDCTWCMSDDELTQMSMYELKRVHLISPEAVPDEACIRRIEKAYPCYWGGYQGINALCNYVDSFDNLLCIGRNGQHRYNNLDHSMETAFRAIDYIAGAGTKEQIWKVNIDTAYHETVLKNNCRGS